MKLHEIGCGSSKAIIGDGDAWVVAVQALKA